MQTNVLVVESRPGLATRTANWLTQAGAKVEKVSSVSQALDRLGSPGVGAVIAPRWLPNLSGEGFLALAQSRQTGLLTALVDNPEQDRGILENLLRKLGAAEAG